MEWLCRVIVFIFGLWLIGVSIFILIIPRVALDTLSKFASTTLINYTELILRLIVGLGIYGLAQYTNYPHLLKLVGLFLIATAIILILIPREWHHKYAIWWANKLKPWQIRVCAPISFVAGCIMIWVSI